MFTHFNYGQIDTLAIQETIHKAIQENAFEGTILIADQGMFTSYPAYNYTGYSVWTYNYPFIASQPKIMERRGGILGGNVVLVRFLDSNKTLIILSNNNKFNPDTFGETTALKEALMLAIGSEEARNR